LTGFPPIFSFSSPSRTSSDGLVGSGYRVT
jgi:hypothetical protein